MKKLAILLMPLVLSGCFDDLTEQQEFINQVRASTKSKVEPIPEIKQFTHFAYTAGEKRSPFVAPKPEVIQDRLLQTQNCLHPELNRKKEALERYPLENVVMRGTLGDQNDLMALLTAPDETLHRVSVGNYIGLFHGKVTQVQNGFVELLELIPDGAGCWKERLTKIEIVEAGNASS